jgi:hypothetical protein
LGVHTITIPAKKAFVWPKRVRLIPSENITIILPGALVANGEEIGAIINVSDDAEIGFKESQNPGELFSQIIVKVSKGDGVRINRSTQAMLVGESERPVMFQVED